MNLRNFALLLCFGVIALPGGAAGGDPLAEAKKLFASYVALTNAFDPAVADLYADDAKIENTRKYPDGTRKSVIVPVAKYKEILRAAMPAAKQRGDTSEFFAVDYKVVGERVQISATRFSNVKQDATPIVFVVGPGPGGKWVILEETSESRA